MGANLITVPEANKTVSLLGIITKNPLTLQLLNGENNSAFSNLNLEPGLQGPG